MSTLYVDNLQPNLGSQVAIPNLKPLAGSVVQVVQAETQIEVVTGTSAAVPIGLSATITPTSATSKILITASVQARVFKLGSADAAGGCQIYRDSTLIYVPVNNYEWGYCHPSEPSSSKSYRIPYELLDSPSTTSAITYSIYGLCRNGDGLTQKVDFQDDGSYKSFITLMEIAQ